MDNNEKFNIHVILNGWRLPPLKIRRIDEEIYRRAEKCFNNELHQTMQMYKVQLDEALKLLAYTAIVNFEKADRKYNNLVGKLENMGNDVDNILDE